MKYLVLFALLAGCGGDENNAGPDAGNRPDAPPTCAPQSAPLRAGMHKLFVAFGGVTLTLGACDDARSNCTSLVTSSSAAVPAFTNSSRVPVIAGMVQDALAPFSVDVVTTRPASGEYRMVTVGGTAALVGGAAVQTHAVKSVCDATNHNAIALVFEGDVDVTDRQYADTIAGAFGRMAGVVPTTKGGDCMCTASNCGHSLTCTFGASVVTEVGNSCMRTMQNEQQLLMDAVGCR